MSIALGEFFELYAAGKIPAENIHDYVGYWHDCFKNTDVYPPLHVYLGLTAQEYALWVMDDNALPGILMRRKTA